VKRRIIVLVEQDVFDRLRAVGSLTGRSNAEQVREGIRMWLEYIEWPPRRDVDQPAREE